jgi:hypothetical protein
MTAQPTAPGKPGLLYGDGRRWHTAQLGLARDAEGLL